MANFQWRIAAEAQESPSRSLQITISALGHWLLGFVHFRTGNPARSRHCEWGANPQLATIRPGRMGRRGGATIHKSGDLSEGARPHDLAEKEDGLPCLVCHLGCLALSPFCC